MRKLEATHQLGASRRTFLRGSGSVIAAGVAAAVLDRRDALAQSATASPANPHDAAPTRFQDIGGIRLAYRRFGKEGSTPVVCLQHFTGT